MAEEEQVQQTPEEENRDDLRAELEAAFDEPEETQTEEAPVGEEPSQEETTEPATEGAGGEVSDASPAGQPEGPGAPIDWSPDLREQWSGLPDTVKQKIAERESQIAQAMQGSAQARHIAGTLGQLQNQYGAVMAAEGVQDPLQMVNNVLQVVSELRMGTPTQKAAKLADLVQAYGVTINDLDDALSERFGAEPSQNSQLEQLIEQRMQPVNQMMQQMAMQQNAQRQNAQYAAQNEVQQFAQTAEFLNDVRHDMADLIDLATRQGREMTVQEAYDKACAMNPQISQVLNQRAEQQRLAEASKSVASKQNAASSLAPGNPGAKPMNSFDNLTDALNAAWDEHLG